ncbi:pyridine nucleotide-disulfide oxidoreductase [Intrasporangium oryzae NRRL B-24470]|uniref:Pyridine nucleotide-disulfide oxidoreductase n=1 Tax=Intrasporangium oryzae NRRL B-24470 TaxID=1386089 RepID=W9GD93_9MICO|nr:FAD-dependent oxidoreductase [Intrasporangium oryzae]EWT02803.1 pyridine nucleotide-disulfide oxidoreductase [Intrasporangium oryzae NRRL B-24470]
MSSATSEATYVIVGGGLAGAKAVEGIRESDPDGSIVIVAAEEHIPYERPPLSKGVLKGDDTADSAFTHPQEWYAEQHVELRLGDAATAIDPAARTVTLASGATLGYDRLLLATGSTVRRLDVPGADLMDVLYLRTMGDSAALRSRLVAGSNVAVVGAGWIGLEVAAAARERGCEVTIVEPQASPLLGVVGERVGGWFADLHRAHGVDLRLGTGVDRFEGDGQVTGVVTSDGETIQADTVVVGVGITPTTALAEAAGLEVDNGVRCDASLRTSDPHIWAAGDVASWHSTTLGTHVRVEHWANAQDGGLAAGRSMAGQDVTYDPVPFFFSDQYDAGLEYAGYVPRGTDAEVVLRGDPATNEFMAFWVVPEGEGVRVLAGMHVNVWDTIDAVQQLVRNRTVVDRDRLADPDTALDSLAAPA